MPGNERLRTLPPCIREQQSPDASPAYLGQRRARPGITKWAFREGFHPQADSWWKNCSTGLARWRWNGDALRPRSEHVAALLRYLPPAIAPMDEGVNLGYMRGIAARWTNWPAKFRNEKTIRVASEHVRHFRLDALKAMLRHGLERTAPHDPE